MAGSNQKWVLAIVCISMILSSKTVHCSPECERVMKDCPPFLLPLCAIGCNSVPHAADAQAGAQQGVQQGVKVSIGSNMRRPFEKQVLAVSAGGKQ